MCRVGHAHVGDEPGRCLETDSKTMIFFIQASGLKTDPKKAKLKLNEICLARYQFCIIYYNLLMTLGG